MLSNQCFALHPALEMIPALKDYPLIIAVSWKCLDLGNYLQADTLQNIITVEMEFFRMIQFSETQISGS